MPTTDKLPRQRFRLAIGQAARLRFTMASPPGDVDEWTMRFRIRRGADSPLVSKTSGSGIESVDSSELEAGQVGWDVSIARADTLGAASGEADFALWNIANGSENPNAIGTVNLFSTADGTS